MAKKLQYWIGKLLHNYSEEKTAGVKEVNNT